MSFEGVGIRGDRKRLLMLRMLMGDRLELKREVERLRHRIQCAQQRAIGRGPGYPLEHHVAGKLPVA